MTRSSVCLALGVDRISAADFMQLVGDSTSVTGPTDKRQHNALLLLVEPQDTLATLVFRIASGTQVWMRDQGQSAQGRVSAEGG